MIVHCHFAQDAVVQAYWLSRRLKDKIAVIPHGSYTATYENSMDRRQARQYFAFGEQDTVFLFLGQIRPYKGVFHLVSAFQKLDRPQARLVIAGMPMNEEIAKELNRHVRADKRIQARLAFIADDEIQFYVNAADVVTLPYQEVLTSGGVLLAMSFGKAVIAPRLGCIPEVLDNGGAFLYDPRREDGLLHAMRQALNADLAAMGRHNLERARQCSWDEIAQKTYAVYGRCLV